MKEKNVFPPCPAPLALRNALKKESKKRKNQTRISVYGNANNEIKIFQLVFYTLKKIDRLMLSKSHYFEFLKLGLYLEQHQQILDLKKFSLLHTEIHRINEEKLKNKFKINIQNINEDNPILNVSDSLRISSEEKMFYVKVASVHRNFVIIVANKKFCTEYSEKKRYDVHLIFNDYTFRCGHEVLKCLNLDNAMPYIFPSKNWRPFIAPKEINNNQQYWFQVKISKNPEQKQAVLNICAKSSFPAPYVLYGPPGTGKTATVVEAVCQIWKDSTEHILICAPSNAACDVVTLRILQFIQPINVLRIYSANKDYNTISPKLKGCCNYNYEGFAENLEHASVISKRIIITTLSSSAKLMDLKILKFTHVFIDEAGQSTQPDALLPLLLIKITESERCQIVVSGDPQQLGPCVMSKLAEPILGESMLEKLMRHEPYKKARRNGYDPKYITKLIRNYRSGADIIHVSNKLFYDNELIACSNEKVGVFPIIFHAVKGEEKKIQSSTSSYNEEEMKRVLHYVKYFITKKVGGKKFTAKDIGIVTPFSLQSLKLRRELERRKIKNVDVGTVEIFQGQEKEVIIISTVRSKTYRHGERGEHIGFLSNPRRFNVALTRPKTFLVVVGNPSVLQVDRCWRYLLEFCKEKNACRGDDFELEEDVDHLLRTMNLGINSKKSGDLFPENYKLFAKK